MPNIKNRLQSLIEKGRLEYDEIDKALWGFKQFLYFEKSENTNRFWKVVIGIWRNKSDFDNDLDPLRVIRITTNDFREIVRDKYTHNLYDEIPIEDVCYDENIRTFY